MKEVEIFLFGAVVLFIGQLIGFILGYKLLKLRLHVEYTEYMLVLEKEKIQ
jgi:hypothetical protein